MGNHSYCPRCGLDYPCGDPEHADVVPLIPIDPEEEAWWEFQEPE